ncbi:MAG: anhydro-N-acetylmuramic acid kinase, partial [Betaproteobacteria bacterium]|nr:anhydro-N-acetylmuramic acid kinase [Betaproteobacteria bacterium]
MPAPAAPTRFIGLMSGTSLDGVDGVLARLDDNGRIQVEHHASLGFDAALRDSLFALNHRG